MKEKDENKIKDYFYENVDQRMLLRLRYFS